MKHEKPTGKKCQNIDSSVIAISENSTTETDGMEKVLKTLGQISKRLDKLEKRQPIPQLVKQANGDAGGEEAGHDDDDDDYSGESGEEDAGDKNQASGNLQSQAPIKQKHSTGLMNAGKTLDELFSSDNKNKHYDEGLVDNGYTFDPRSMLTVKAKNNKAVHIHLFLHEKTKRRRLNRRRDLVMEGTEDGDHVVLRTEDKHPYSNITIAEWGAANCRLMNHLLQVGQLKRVEMEYYLAYTAKINDFAAKYEWESILEYDYEYRELQAEHGFKWGVTNPDMELQILVPRHNGGRRSSPHAQPRQPHKQNFKTEDCRLYLAHGHCRFGDNCRYRHPQQNTPKPTDSVSKNGRTLGSKTP